ncbi:transglutaminase TgpA family protein [Massilia sp. S19_KUP03_FR1]|uniref:transglutaminase TgpA family protein n=1 Tax=Massilia sp. S19_KUP03_FR1 TaxID=3025503 RepID=UPI002FCD39A3
MIAPLRARLRGYRVMSRDKADTLLLLGSTLLVLAPHSLHLPIWVSLLCLTTLAWRALITLGGRRMPSSTLLLPLAGAAMLGVLQTYQTILGKDPGVAMLVMLVAFKMLEMHARRDLFVVVFLCFFLALTNFFYSQSIGMGVMIALGVLALVTTQLTFQYTGSVPPLRRRVRTAASIIGLAAPLALFLFIAFPRIQGPLWGLPSDANSGRTGLSADMTPGKFSSLAQSEAVVFRAHFTDPAPEQAQLYWRAIVLGAFDGRTWTRSRERSRPQTSMPPGLVASGPALRYDVTLEPLSTRWLYVLDLPRRVPELDSNVARMSPEFELSAQAPVDLRLRYDAESSVQYTLQGGAELPDAARWLQLPAGRNPRTLAMGAALAAQGDPAQRVNAVLQRFRSESFVYTLEPPLLGANPVDEFLLQTRAGFCEHYSSAFVVLMRAAGVPARVVTGYQGGDINPVDGFMTVRQSDAHAWAEVWLGARGWVRVDPTAAVAPERIRRSLSSAIPPRPPFGIEGLGGLIDFSRDRNGVLAQLRYHLSAVNNGWNQWVLNYTPERQSSVVGALMEGVSNWRSLAVLAVSLLLLWGAHKLRVRRRRDPIDALYSALCQRLGQLGHARQPDEGPTAYAARLARANLEPARHIAIAQFLRCYSAYRYGPAAPAPDLPATMKSLLAQCR